MVLFLISFSLLLIVVGLMAIGTIMANKPIKGSCGGLSALGPQESCMICGATTQWQRDTPSLGDPDLGTDIMTQPR